MESNNNKCRIRIVHRQDAEKGKRYEVRFPDEEWKAIGVDAEGKTIWENKVSLEETTLVGYMEIKGNWRNGDGKCIFHPLKNSE